MGPQLWGYIRQHAAVTVTILYANASMLEQRYSVVT